MHKLVAGAEELFAIAPEPKELCAVEGGHIEAIPIDPEYRGYVAGFLDRVFGP